ncbi:MAG: hypothetical protein H0W01_16405 [Pseudonocardiales bacterium]|nr:hypothetical protein [Pseudonocardiales bacterium]
MAAVVAVGALTGGCGQTAGSPAAAPTPTLTAAEWTEQFCSALLAAKVPSDVPTLDRLNRSDIPAVTKALDAGINAYGAGVSAFDKLGPSPVKSGDEAVAKFKTALVKFKDVLTAARDKIAGLPSDDPATAATADQVLDAANAEGKAARPDVSGLDDTDLKAAAASAPSCKAAGVN